VVLEAQLPEAGEQEHAREFFDLTPAAITRKVLAEIQEPRQASESVIRL
jgi:hypothetical protein